MPRRSPQARSLCVLAVLTLAACGTSPIIAPGTASTSSTSSSSTESSSTSTSTSTASSSGGAAAIVSGPCSVSASGTSPPAGAVCGSLSVPLDYSDSTKGTIQIPTIKVPATKPAQRIGSLLVNPGGPGASGVQFVEDTFAPSTTGQPGLFASLNQRFDIVGFDPRGTGDPDAVSCLSTAQLDAMVAVDPIVDDPAEKQAMIDTSKLVGLACQQKSGRLLPYVGTDNVARDLDGLRAALGDNKLSYFGFSYGTKIGSTYAQMFPTHIRAMVLDGDVDTSIGLIAQTEQQADGLSKNYQEFLRRCTASGSCAMGANPGAAITRLLTKLDATPVALNGRTVGRGEALVALLASMYDTRIWDQVSTLFGRAISSGDVRGLQLLSDLYTGRNPGGYDHQMESNLAIDCLDEAVPADLGTYDAEAQKTEARDPMFGEAAVYGSLPCAYWPVHGKDPKPVSVSGAPPIVLIGATNDPATPYVWSQGLQRQIQGSVLLTREGFGHTSYEVSTCIAGPVDSYLFNLTVPAAGITCQTNP